MSERLTEWTGDRWIARQAKLNGKTIGDKAIYAKLAHFEDLQEQGLLVELPCNTGRFVYILDNMQINRCLAENTLVAQKGLMARVLGTDKDICYVVYKEDIGKTVFLTIAEAQAALERIMSK